MKVQSLSIHAQNLREFMFKVLFFQMNDSHKSDPRIILIISITVNDIIVERWSNYVSWVLSSNLFKWIRPSSLTEINVVNIHSQVHNFPRLREKHEYIFVEKRIRKAHLQWKSISKLNHLIYRTNFVDKWRASTIMLSWFRENAQQTSWVSISFQQNSIR